jgi:hypothetical protein
LLFIIIIIDLKPSLLHITGPNYYYYANTYVFNFDFQNYYYSSSLFVFTGSTTPPNICDDSISLFPYILKENKIYVSNTGADNNNCLEISTSCRSVGKAYNLEINNLTTTIYLYQIVIDGPIPDPNPYGTTNTLWMDNPLKSSIFVGIGISEDEFVYFILFIYFIYLLFK